MKQIIALGLVLMSTQAWSAQVATVNGRPVTDKDVQVALGGMNEGQRKGLLKDLNSKKQVVNSVVEQEILVQEAEKQKLDQDQEYKDAVAAFRKQYLVNRLLQKNLSKEMSDTAVKKYYSNHKTDFSTDTVHAQHILVDSEKAAQEMLKAARASGADFQALAEKHSIDPSAKNNRGDLGYFGFDQFVPEFSQAAFGAKKGSIIGPVKTAFGYHVIKVIDKKVGKTLEFHEVEMKVRNALKQQLIQNYVEKLKDTAKVSVDEKALEKL